MPAIRFYESALCGDTGVFGPDVDRSLVDVPAEVRHLQGLGAETAGEPSAYAEHESVRECMRLVGSERLPLTVVDGVTVAAGTYSSRGQLLAFAVLSEVAEEQRSRPELGLSGKSGGCCGGSTSSCWVSA